MCGFYDSKHNHCGNYLSQLFNYESRKLVWGTTTKPILKYISKFINWKINLFPEFMEKRIPFLIPIEALHIKLKVIKQNG